MFSKTLSALVAAAVLSTSVVAAPAPAFAKNRNRDVAVGAFFGLAAGILAGAVISRNQAQPQAYGAQPQAYQPRHRPVEPRYQPQPTYIDGYADTFEAGYDAPRDCRRQPVVRWIPGRGEVTEFKTVCR